MYTAWRNFLCKVFGVHTVDVPTDENRGTPEGWGPYIWKCRFCNHTEDYS